MEYVKNRYGDVGALGGTALCRMQKMQKEQGVMEGKVGMNAAMVDTRTIGDRLDKKIADAQAVVDEYKALKKKLQEGRILELTPTELNQIMYAI